MKLDRKTILLVLGIFALTVVGTLLFTLYSLTIYNQLNLSPTTSAFPSYWEAAYIFFALLAMTGLILLLIRKRWHKVILGITVAVTLLVLADFLDLSLYNVPFGGLLFLPLVVLVPLYYFKYAGIIGRDIINIIMFITIGSILALALDVQAALALTGLVAIYDYIAVFKTKHMLTLSKGISTDMFIGGIVLMAKKKARNAFIGGGDIVFPSMLITSVYLSYHSIAAFVVFLAALAGLGLVIYLAGTRKKAYPAMAVIGPLEIALFAVYILSVIIL